MLRIHVFSIFTIKTPWALNHVDTDTCTLTSTCGTDITESVQHLTCRRYKGLNIKNTVAVQVECGYLNCFFIKN